MYGIRGNKELHSREIGAFYVFFFPSYFLLGTDSIKGISLIESAAAFSSKPSPKCLLEKIDVITGEESEHNVLKVCISCIALSGTTYIHGIITISRDVFKNKGRSIVFVKTELLK